MTLSSTLASRLNEAHRAACAAASEAITHAIEAGRLLAEAKAAVPHGAWLGWLADNFSGDARTAQRYMRLYEHRAALEANAARVSDLSVRGALQILKTAKPVDHVVAATGITRARMAEFADRLADPTITPAECQAIAKECGAFAGLWGERRLRAERKAGGLLASDESDAESGEFTPPPGKALLILGRDMMPVVVVPSEHEGFFYVAAYERDATNALGATVGTRRPIRAPFHTKAIPPASKDMATVKVIDLDDPILSGLGNKVGSPWSYNQFLYTSAAEAVRCGTLGGAA